MSFPIKYVHVGDQIELKQPTRIKVRVNKENRFFTLGHGSWYLFFKNDNPTQFRIKNLDTRGFFYTRGK